MIAIVSLLIVLILSVLIVRTAAVALTFTGLSSESARFQARSAFTGVGFTTSESESLVNHPVRRRIVMLLMFLGNAGIVTAVSTLLLSFAGTHETGAWLPRLGVLSGGALLLYGIARIPWVDRGIHRLIGWGLKKWTRVDARDYEQLLMFEKDYGISELAVNEHDWLAGKTLGELRLDREGLSVLGIHHRDGEYAGAPAHCARIQHGDRLILYGRSKHLAELDCRSPGEQGDFQHEQACSFRREDIEDQQASADPVT